MSMNDILGLAIELESIIRICIHVLTCKAGATASVMLKIQVARKSIWGFILFCRFA